MFGVALVPTDGDYCARLVLELSSLHEKEAIISTEARSA